MSKRPTYEELKRKLSEAEALIANLRVGEVDEIISERDAALLGVRELEEAYIESEQNFHNAMDICPLGIRIVTKEGMLLYANQAMLDICGLASVEELEKIPRKQLYTPESYAAHQERKAKRKMGEFLTGDYEISIICPHGGVRHLQVFRREIVWGGESQFMSMYQDVTERMWVEEALEKERQESRLIIDSSPIIVFYKDTEGKFVRVNKALAQALDMPEEDFLGKTVFDLYPSEIAQSMTDDDNEVLQSGRPKLNIMEQYKSASGLRWVRTDKVPIIDKNGTPSGLIGFAQDITERKNAEEALMQSRDYLESLTNSMADVVFSVKMPERVIEWVNDSIKLMGYKPEECIGRTTDFLYAENKGFLDFGNKLKQAIADSREIMHTETMLKKKDGTVFPAEITVTFTRENGDVVRVTSIVRDITERKQAEEALSAERQRLFDVLETLPTMICLLTPDYHVAFANRSFRDKFGESQGRHCYEYCFGQTEPCEFCESYKVLETGKPHQWEVTTPDGKTVIDAYDFPFTNVDGSPMILEMDIDITESKKAEKALAESENKFRNLFETMAQGVVYQNSEGVIISANQAAEHILGLTHDQIQGRTSVDPRWRAINEDGSALPGEQHPSMVSLRTGKPVYNVVMGIYHPDAEEYRWILVNSVPEFHPGEIKPYQVYTTFTDITGRKTAAERHQTILNTTLDGFWMVDLKGNFLEVNDSYCKMVGYTREELLGMSITEIEAIEDAAVILGHIKRIKEHGSDHFETRHKRKDGQVIDVDISVNYLDVGDGQLSVFVRDITDRKKADENLRQSEEKYRNVVELIPDGILIIDRSGVIKSMNKAVTDITGFPEEEVVGKHISKVPVLSLKNVPQALKIFNDIIRGKGPARVEIPCRKKDGTPRIGEFRVSLMKTAGKTTGIQVMARDVTERNKAEEALRESEEKFYKAFRSSPDRIVITTLADGKFVEVNDSYLRFTGYTREDVIGKSTTELGSWAGNMTRKIILQKLNENGRLENEEVKLRIKSGEVRTSLFSAELIDIKGEPCMISVATDITERKKAEERINNLNKTLLCIRSVNQLITREKDRDSLIKSICDTLVKSRNFNNAWIALLDNSRKLSAFAASGSTGDFSPVYEMISQGMFPPCVQKVLRKEKMVITRDQHLECADCPLHPDNTGLCGITIRLEYEGDVYGILSASMPENMLSDRDEISLFNEIAVDIAFALHDIAFEDEHRQLEYERLRSAKLESISTLAGGIAHDFNNLLTGIMGNIGLARKYSGTSKKVLLTLEEAEKAAVRAKDLTQQLLTFARGGKPVKKILDITELVSESAAFALRGSAVRLELSLPDDLWPVEIDEGQINQVIHNLVINADEAMPGGGVLKITGVNSVLKEVSALPLPKGKYVRIDIQDTGTGISEEHLERIFEPYFSTKKKGSGLGLSSAYSIIKNHGGYLTAESTLNKGTTFYIYLPASRKPARTKQELKTGSPGQVGGRVLVMDDEESIRKMLDNMLKLAGYEAELTSNGDEALEKYSLAMESGKPFDAVIMDLTIPGGMGGKETIQRMLKIDPGARVIVSSGYATDPIMSEYKKYGFSAVIAKPYSVRHLEDTLHNLPKRKKK